MTSAPTLPEPATDLGRRFALAIDELLQEIVAKAAREWVLAPLLLLLIRPYLRDLAASIDAIAAHVRATGPQPTPAMAQPINSPPLAPAIPRSRHTGHRVTSDPSQRRTVAPREIPPPSFADRGTRRGPLRRAVQDDIAPTSRDILRIRWLREVGQPLALVKSRTPSRHNPTVSLAQIVTISKRHGSVCYLFSGVCAVRPDKRGIV